MEKDYYAPNVVFVDPLTKLEGIDAYQTNVDLLASRTLLGKILFADAGIVLHSVTQESATQLTTRWTLRMTAKILPWQPTARFTGVSVYKIAPGGPQGVQVVQQNDYWDSINLQQGGSYAAVDKGAAVADFLDQLKPQNLAAPSAGAELPYQLLRRGKDYEVRRYPAFSAVEIDYERRDDGFATLGSFSSGLTPQAPALLSVPSSGSKRMLWPLSYALPGTEGPLAPEKAVQKAQQSEWSECRILEFPSQVVAVARFTDASVEPVVRRANRKLRDACARDGLQVVETDELRFAQYDAIFSMGERRGEVWMDLQDGGHPW